MPEYTVHPGEIMIKFNGPDDRIVRVTNKVTNGVTDEVTDEVTDRERLSVMTDIFAVELLKCVFLY